MNIRQKYHNFLRRLINEKYLNNFNNVKILGENLINGYYFIILEVDEKCTLEEIFDGIY